MQTGRQADSQTDKQTNRQTEKQIEQTYNRQTNRKTDRLADGQINSRQGRQTDSWNGGSSIQVMKPTLLAALLIYADSILKVQKGENFLGADFEICTIS